MRRFLCAVPLFLAMPAMAEIQYPEPSDPAARQMLERYRNDAPTITAPEFTKMPATLPAWPCDVPEVDQYKMGGLVMAHPELKKDIAKQTRKLLRQMGMDGNAGGDQKYSDIQFAPIVAQCKNGKLDGEVQLLVSYRMQMEHKNTMVIAEKPVTMTSVMDSNYVVRRHFTVKNGEPGGDSMMVTRTVSTNKVSYDDPKMNSMVSSMNNKPIENLSVTYVEARGQRMAMFRQIDEVKVSSGFLVPSVKTQKALQSVFFFPVDEKHTVSNTYTNKRLTGVGRTKEGKTHGDQITYMDNMYKAMGQRLDTVPGMENAREVVIDGVDMIERHMCFQDGMQIKTATCSNE